MPWSTYKITKFIMLKLQINCSNEGVPDPGTDSSIGNR
jgi:hypothetical protein